MGEYTAELSWERGSDDFLDKRYSRLHVMRFDGGLEVPASSSPHSVPVPLSDARAVDPEEAFVAALASCHLLWFLSLAAEAGYRVERYRDRAVGTLDDGGDGRLAMTVVTLRPAVVFTATAAPSRQELLSLHEDAHARCYIANSVKTDVRCEPVLGDE